MKRWGLVAIATFVAAFTFASTADAALSLVSAEMSGETGSSYAFLGQPPIFGNSLTPYGPVPFPNDAHDFAGFTADGLKVTTDRVGTFSGNTHIGGMTRDWTDHRFSVVFQTDAPAPFTFQPPTPDFAFPLITLQKDDQAPQALTLHQGAVTGVLEPGRYTFAGATNAHNIGAPGDGPFSYRIAFTGLSLTVVPEPATLPLLAAAALLGLGRRRRARVHRPNIGILPRFSSESRGARR